MKVIYAACFLTAPRLSLCGCALRTSVGAPCHGTVDMMPLEPDTCPRATSPSTTMAAPVPPPCLRTPPPTPSHPRRISKRGAVHIKKTEVRTQGLSRHLALAGPCRSRGSGCKENSLCCSVFSVFFGRSYIAPRTHKPAGPTPGQGGRTPQISPKTPGKFLIDSLIDWPRSGQGYFKGF